MPLLPNLRPLLPHLDSLIVGTTIRMKEQMILCISLALGKKGHMEDTCKSLLNVLYPQYRKPILIVITTPGVVTAGCQQTFRSGNSHLELEMTLAVTKLKRLLAI